MSGTASGRVVFLGGGAVGSYTGGMLAAAGHRVVLIDGWPEHVEAVRARGLMIATPEGDPSPIPKPGTWARPGACARTRPRLAERLDFHGQTLVGIVRRLVQVEQKAEALADVARALVSDPPEAA